MKKTILTIVLSTLILTLTGCKYIEEKQAEGIIEDYYQAIIDENYEKAFKQLHLYDYDAETEQRKVS
ncbi:hypothetical protein E3U55_14615 [Filobacillus milosensis]|uniref:Uncharacterized protein n=1 Tax=Filobacillus milosensis TaxID=94137 RepID=A0A4Y8IHG9_9BACI|nr:hypothetical protein [Filobacillus milosensis]TFB14143.1 hypothetical protein E3U55_14615 [Filobacillus milosensis]